MPELAGDPDTALAFGQIPGRPCKAAWSTQWDRREDWRPGPGDDLDWIGEDEKGVWCRMHPLALLQADEDLAEEIDRFYCGQNEMAPEDWDTLSNWQFEVKLVASLARQREDSRRMKDHGRE